MESSVKAGISGRQKNRATPNQMAILVESHYGSGLARFF